jgi:hypothetical protein
MRICNIGLISIVSTHFLESNKELAENKVNFLESKIELFLYNDHNKGHLKQPACQIKRFLEGKLRQRQKNHKMKGLKLNRFNLK